MIPHSEHISPQAGLVEPLRLGKARNLYDSEQDRRFGDLVLDGYTLGTLLLARSAESDGATIEWITKTLCVATLPDGVQVLIRSHRCTESAVASAILRDKHLSSEILLEAGVSVPQNVPVATADQAVQAWRKIGRSVVVKPRFGSKGRGISVDLDSAQAVRDAYTRARVYGASVVIEEFVDGDEFRFIGTGVDCHSMVARVGPHVVGDGESSIAQLIHDVNSHRRKNPHTCNRLIPVGVETAWHLQQGGRSLDSVLAPQERICVLGVANFSQGADAIECLDNVHEHVRQTGIDAVAALPGLAWAAVDLMVDRRSGRAYVLEVNTDGGLGGHAFPGFGTPRDVSYANWSIQRDHARGGGWSIEPVGSIQRTAERSPRTETGGGADWVRYGAARFSRYLRAHLADSGRRPQRMGAQLHSVPVSEAMPEFLCHEGDLLLSGALTLGDKQAVVDAVGRFLSQRLILERGNVPCVRGTSVDSLSDCAAWVATRGSSSVVGWNSDWHGPGSQVVETSEGVAHLDWNRSPGVVVQERPPGLRLRVLADRYAARTVFSAAPAPLTHGELTTVDRLTEEIAEVAVGAVRAVPELRWASVDLVLPDMDMLSGQVLVEGLTLNPWLTPDLELLQGSMEACFETILEGRAVRRDESAQPQGNDQAP